MKIHKPWLASSLATGLLVLLFAGCSTPTQAPAPDQPSPTILPPSATPLPPTDPATSTSTPAPPTSTPTAKATESPTLTPTEPPTSTGTATQAPTVTRAPLTGRAGSGLPAPSGEGVKIYFVQKETGGGAGCGTAVAVGSGVAKEGDIPKDVAAGLKSLFSAKWEYSGALYNPLSGSNLRVQEVQYDDGLIQVWLSGDYNPTGEKCDNTLVKAQIWSTIKQFRGIERTNIFLNNIPFGDRLSNDK